MDGRPQDRRLFVALPLALAALQVVMGGADLLLAAALDRVSPGSSVTTFGVIAGWAAIVALLVYPLVGAASDRTSSRLGRRSAWLVAGTAGATLALLALGRAATVAGLGVAYVVTIAGLAAMLVPLYASIPDRVDAGRRGSIGALVGGATIIGGITGNLVAARFAQQTDIGTAVFAATLVAGCAAFLVLGRERPVPAGRPERGLAVARERTPWRAYRDLAWVTLGRFALLLGYASVTGLAYYLYRDHLDTPDPAAAVAGFAVVSGLSTLVASLVTGPWSDRVASRRPFVAAAGVLVALGAILPALVPTAAAMLAAGALVGIGLGTYLAVGTALATLVLPSATDRGRDIGAIGVATAAAQGAAPFLGSAVAAELGYPVLLAGAMACGLVAAALVVPVRTAR